MYFMLNGPALILIASTDPCCALRKGTLTWHVSSTNTRVQLNLGHLPNSFGFLCSTAVGSEYTVLVISDQITETSEIRAFLGYYWRFLEELQTPSTQKRSLCRPNKAYMMDMGMEVGKVRG